MKSIVSAAAAITVLATTSCAMVEPHDDESISTQDVITGSVEPAVNFPWVVKIPDCHGTLITPNWILTAAHCLSEDPGGGTLARPLDVWVARTANTPRRRKISDIVIIHEGYSGKPSFLNDIALIHIPVSFQYDDFNNPSPQPYVQPVELALGPAFTGQPGLYASIKNGTPIANPDDKVSVMRAPVACRSSLQPNEEFYTYSPSTSGERGDSGSGYVMYGGGKYFVSGVASSITTLLGNQSDCPAGPVPVVDMMDVNFYAPWIRAKLAAQNTVLPAPADGRKTDILWRHSAGGLAIWWMDNGKHVSDAYPSYFQTAGVTGNDWKVSAAADFTGDGLSDILWRNTNGALAVWKLVNGAMVADSYPSYQGGGGPVGNEYEIAGVGNFDSDSTRDILWWNKNTGALAVWLIRNGVFYLDRYPGSRTTDWKVKGVADVNGDGISDVLWRRTDGTLETWIITNGGGGYSVTGSLGTQSNSWEIAGTADFNSDRRDDILWRNTSTGAVKVWLMWGATSHSEESSGTVPLVWKIEKLGDFNGDGAADILWRTTDANGTLAVWFMYGGLNFARAYPGAVAPSVYSIPAVAHFDAN